MTTTANAPSTGESTFRLTGDTWVLTELGPRQVRDLQGSRFVALCGGRPFASAPAGFRSVGEARTVRVSTSEGFEVKLPDEARVLVRRREGLAASQDVAISLPQLDPGEALLVGDHRGSEGWRGFGSHDEGYLAGLNHQFGADEGISESYERSAERFHLGFIRGLFDTLGYMSLMGGPTLALPLGQPGRAAAVQRMLARLGVYADRERGTLFVAEGHIWTFRDRIELWNLRLRDELQVALALHPRQPAQFTALAELLEDGGVQQLYEVNFSQASVLEANGLCVAPTAR